jgi:hypothetical protein
MAATPHWCVCREESSAESAGKWEDGDRAVPTEQTNRRTVDVSTRWKPTAHSTGIATAQCRAPLSVVFRFLLLLLRVAAVAWLAGWRGLSVSGLASSCVLSVTHAHTQTARSAHSAPCSDRFRAFPSALLLRSVPPCCCSTAVLSQRTRRQGHSSRSSSSSKLACRRKKGNSAHADDLVPGPARLPVASPPGASGANLPPSLSVPLRSVGVPA